LSKNTKVFCLVSYVDLGYQLFGVFSTEEKAEKAKATVIKNATHIKWDPNPCFQFDIISCNLDSLDSELHSFYNKNETF
jgi:hypothetical protein